MTGAIFVRDLGGHPCALHTGRVETVGGGEKSKEKGGVVWREHCPPWRTLQLFAGISKLSFHSRSSWKRCCFPRDNADCHPPLFRGPFVLSPSLLANQANILRPLFARLLGKMRHNRTPRHCLFCLVWKETLPRVKPPPRLNIYEFSIKEQSLDRREATSCLIIPELKIRNN